MHVSHEPEIDLEENRNGGDNLFICFGLPFVLPQRLNLRVEIN